jgi:60 kDa SS-A/Ro ribonucleoprotein
MANKSLFTSLKGLLPRAFARNEAGGPAYALDSRHALAQFAVTGCFGNVYYATAENQLDQLKKLIEQVDDNVFLAKLAIYSRERAFMKDAPAALLVALAKRDTLLMQHVFDRVVDNGRILRTVFQMVRSGQFGRNALGSSLKRAFQRWLNGASVEKLLSASIGRDPELRDILRMARPVPRDNMRRALFGWLSGRDVAKWAPATAEDLPEQVQALIACRRAETAEAQALIMGELSVRWDLLSDAARSPVVWKAIARKMGPQALRMNLNTLLRQGVLNDPVMVDFVADRLSDANEIRRSRQFPYQFLAAYQNVAADVPHKVRAALHVAAENACENVPRLNGPVVIGLDTSGSMSSRVTGGRGRGSTTKMRCVDVAALFAAAILRRNPDSVVIPFDTQAYEARVDAEDTILGLADRLARYGGGGTDCSIPLRQANTTLRHRKFAGCVLVSDNQSWVYNHSPFGNGAHGSTGLASEWQTFVANQRRLGVASPKLVCIDIQPYGTTQAPERADILNVGGFSDAVFEVVASFLSGVAGRFVAEVESVEL